MKPIWDIARGDGAKYPPLQGDRDVDVAIIGAGITGLTAAIKLIEAGKRVAVLEAQHVGAGSTGRSTGNLYTTVSQGLLQVREKHGVETVKKVVEARGQAIDFVEQAVQRFAIDCEFARRPMYRCLRNKDETKEQRLQAEFEASVAAGLAPESYVDVPELPFITQKAFRLEDQAQFNPLTYVSGLAKAVADSEGLIFEDCKVTNVDAGKGVVATRSGQITANDIIHATHTPKGINLLQAEMQPYQEYGISAELREGEHPDGIFWIVDDSKSVRSYHYAGKQYLVVIGGKHKTGQGKLGVGYFEMLESYASENFAVERFVHRWSAQQYQPADSLPYIGRSAHRNVYVGTGYASDGLTWGTVAGDILSRQILGENVPDIADTLNPRRFTPLKSAKSWIEENTSVAKHLLKGHLLPAERGTIDQIKPGEGGVVTVNGEKLAVYRALNEDHTVMSAVCPHMKCLVNWNGADSTWDCPCHGSRFTAKGALIEGPAYEGLAARSLEPKAEV